MRRLPLFFCSMLRERWLAAALLSSCSVLLLLHLCGIHIMRCPFYDETGLPCPGCGMTRAMSALCHGDPDRALRWHPLAPLVALGGLALLAAATLPEAPRMRFIAVLETIERRTAFGWITFTAFMVHGIWRIVMQPHWPTSLGL